MKDLVLAELSTPNVDVNSPQSLFEYEKAKLLRTRDEEKKAYRLTRIRRLIRQDPALVGDIIDLLSTFQSKNPEVCSKLNDLYMDCMEGIINGVVPLDPEMCAEAVRGLTAVADVNDHYLCEIIEEDVLKKFPYAYSVYLQSLQRKKVRRQIPLVETHNLEASMAKALEQLGTSTGIPLITQGTINANACRRRQDLPPELLAFAALREASGDIKAALSLLQCMEMTMRKRSFEEWIAYLVHYRKLMIQNSLLQYSLLPAVVTSKAETEAYSGGIESLDTELFMATGGWNPSFPGTEKVKKMVQRNSPDDLVGPPLNACSEVFDLIKEYSIAAKRSS